ncbi:pyridoxal kinase [Malassezia sp. CBS 17886]|nr:pyridoxal kinase [Malassezia sp. CBS 17886]
MAHEKGHLLAIQSHVVYGYVGNRAATFPSQLLGWDVDVVNTVQFSNHTGYGRWGGLRFDATHLNDIFENMERNGLLHPARLLTGYTPSPEALDVVERWIEKMRAQTPHLVYLLDPVMGDMDRGMYVNPDVLPIYRRMLPFATIICPNQFEAQALTGIDIGSRQKLHDALTMLHVHYRVPNVLITSLSMPDDELRALGASPVMPDGAPAMLLIGCSWEDGEMHAWMLQFPSLGEYFSGVGDLFSALTLALFEPRVPDTPGQMPPAGVENSPIAHTAALAVASLQSILLRTCDAMVKQGQAAGVDPFQPSHLVPVDERVNLMRLRELRIVQSAQDILHPTVHYWPQRVSL